MVKCKVATQTKTLMVNVKSKIVNYLISADLLSKPYKKRNRPGLVNPLLYDLRWFVNNINVATYTRPVRTVQWEGKDYFLSSTTFF